MREGQKYSELSIAEAVAAWYTVDSTPLRVVILTEVDSPRYRTEAEAAGCSGYLLKSDDPEILVARLCAEGR